MKFKKSFIFICLIICLFSISSICASDVNDTGLASENQISNEMTQENLIEIENQENDELSVQEDIRTFTELSNKINSGAKEISLDADYKYNASEDSDYSEGIQIKNAITIDGKGHTINGTGTSLMFRIVSNDVTLKNINFQVKPSRDKYHEYIYGGIYGSDVSNVKFVNCSFNKYSYIQLNNINNSTIVDCNFYNTIIDEISAYIKFDGNNNKIHNCNFYNCFSEIMLISGNNQEIRGCKFIDCNGYPLILIAEVYRGIGYYEDGVWHYDEYEQDSYNCTIADCIFDQTHGEYVIEGNCFNIEINNCTFIKNEGSSVRFYKNIIVNNCTFIDSISSDYGPAISCESDDEGFIINNSVFINSLDFDSTFNKGNGGSIHVEGNNGIITNCIFINSTASNKGGAIYSIGRNLTIDNNTFINNYAPVGSSIFIYDGIVKDNDFDDENSIFALKDVKVIKKMPALKLNDIEFNYYNPINYIISLTYNNNPFKNKKIILELFQDDYHISYDLITNEKGNINLFNLIKNLDVGTWNLKATYLGDSNYETVTKTSKLLVKPIVPSVILEDISTSVNQETIINAVINRPDNVVVNGGVVNFYVGEKLIGSSHVVNNIAHITYCPSNAGNFTLKAVFEDSNTVSSNNVSKIVVNPVISKIDINQDISYNNSQIDFNLPEDATGVVTITISNKIYATTIDGKVNVDLSTLSSGNYDYVLSYSGDKKYSAFTTAGNLNVNNVNDDNLEKDVTVIVDGVIYSAELVNGSVSVTTDKEDFNKSVIVVVDGKNYNAEVVDGKVVVATDVVPVDNNVIVVVDGVSYPAVLVNGTVNINIDKAEPKKASEFTDIIISDNQLITFVLKDENGKVIANAPISYTVNGVFKTTTTKTDGSFVIVGENGAVIIVKYDGDDKINGINTTLKLNSQITPTDVKIATHFNIPDRAITLNGYAVDVKANEEGIYYTTTLLDAMGRPISNAYIEFAVNNKIYNRTTYANGSFNPYKLNMQRAGRYTMAFNFAGNENYATSFACVCVDLDKKPITIKAFSKTFKASAKTKKYTATLSTIVGSSHDGKAHLKSGLKVALTVNGKTYTSNTNSNGKVTFKITNLSKGSYVANISYAGDMTYEEASKSVSIIVK